MPSGIKLGALEVQLHFSVWQRGQAVSGKGWPQDVATNVFTTLFVVAVHARCSVQVEAPLLGTQVTIGLGYIAVHRKAYGRAFECGACRWCTRGGSGQKLRKQRVVIA